MTATRALATLTMLAGLALTPASSRAQAHVRTADEVTATKAGRLAEAFEARLAGIADAVDGLVGYQVLDVTSGMTFGRAADEPFPTASAIKVGILYELFRQADEGRHDLDRPRPLADAQRAGGSGILQHLTAPQLSPRDHAVLMIVLSDNTSTNVLIDLLGMEAINRRMAALGAATFSLQRRMMDAEAVEHGHENLASPADLVRVMDALRRGEQLSETARIDAHRILRLAGQTALRAGVPPDVPVAAKPGGLPGVRTEVGWVEVKGRPYVLAVMTTFLADEAAGGRAITAISEAAHRYFDRLARHGREGRLR